MTAVTHAAHVQIAKNAASQQHKIDEDLDITALVVGIIALVMAILANINARKYKQQNIELHKETREIIKAEHKITRGKTMPVSDSTAPDKKNELQPNFPRLTM